MAGRSASCGVNELFALLAKPLHPEIYNKKPVTAVMESPTLLIDGQLRLEQVSRLVTQKGGRGSPRNS